jgi:hypothetical protein
MEREFHGKMIKHRQTTSKFSLSIFAVFAEEFNHIAENSNFATRWNGSTDAMSLNGLLDNVSTESFTTHHSPKSTVNRGYQGLYLALNSIVHSQQQIRSNLKF